jgi:iron complex transport system permease protein
MKGVRYCILAAATSALLFLLNLLCGSISIPASEVLRILLGRPTTHETWQFIILETRLPQAITATLCGGALAVSGLMLQTAFKNPLAGPSIFGISGGAGLGVALVMLLLGGSVTAGTFEATGFAAILFGAFIGAMAVTTLIFLFSSMVRNSVMLLIIGVMIGFMSSSVISLLNFFATEEGVKSYAVWGMGNFGGVTMEQIPLFSIVTCIGLIASLLLIKPLNALLLGEQYAENLGINTIRVRNSLLVVTGLLTAITTAYCGPVSFIGLAVPHIARLLLMTENHRQLLPATILTGSVVALACNLICYLPGESGIIPLNAVTPLLGAPVIIYVIVKHIA